MAVQTSDSDRHDSRTQPLNWPWAVASSPIASSEFSGWGGALIRCWRGTSAVMVQPPLDEHYVVIHLGGAKRVERRCDGPSVSRVVENQSLTMVPAGCAYRWQTEGPIAFAHLYLSPLRLEELSGEEFEGRATSLIEKVGCPDALLELLFLRMLDEIQDPRLASPLLLDSLLVSFCTQLAQQHVARRPRLTSHALALAPYRLRRVTQFIEANLGQGLALRELAEAAGLSQSHFIRAFGLATGSSPYRYVMRRRIELAKVRLLATDDALDAVSAAAGFKERHQFSVMFKRLVGVAPYAFRAARSVKRTPERTAQLRGQSLHDAISTKGLEAA